MKRLGLVRAALGLTLACGSTQAQPWEISLLGGFTPAAGLDRRARELDELRIRGGFTLGAQAARGFTERFGAEVLWTRQASALQVETAGTKTDLFTFSIDDLHGDAVYHFADEDAELRPFVLGGLGATFFSGGVGIPSETKLSVALGGGIKYFRWKSIGLRAQARYKPVILNDTEAGDFCDPYGFCQGWLQQLEMAVGVVFRF